MWAAGKVRENAIRDALTHRMKMILGKRPTWLCWNGRAKPWVKSSPHVQWEALATASDQTPPNFLSPKQNITVQKSLVTHGGVCAVLSRSPEQWLDDNSVNLEATHTWV